MRTQWHVTEVVMKRRKPSQQPTSALNSVLIVYVFRPACHARRASRAVAQLLATAFVRSHAKLFKYKYKFLSKLFNVHDPAQLAGMRGNVV